MTRSAWRARIARAVREGGWIVQERIALERAREPIIQNGKTGAELMNRDIDPYVFNGKYVQCMARFSPSLVTNGIQGGAVQIVGTVGKKRS